MQGDRQDPVALAKLDDVARILGFPEMAGEQGGAQLSDLVLVQVAHGVAQEIGWSRGRGLQAVPFELVEDLRVIGHGVHVCYYAAQGDAMADDSQRVKVDDSILTQAAETIGSTLGSATRAVVDGAHAASGAANAAAATASTAAAMAGEAATRAGAAASYVAAGASKAVEQALKPRRAVRRAVSRTVKRVQRQVKVTARKARKAVSARGLKKTAVAKRSAAKSGARPKRKAAPAKQTAARKASGAKKRAGARGKGVKGRRGAAKRR